jgi:hypothetical protein
MKNLRRRSARIFAAANAIILTTAASAFSSAAPLGEARITQLANDVKLLPKATPAHAAAINQTIPEGSVLRTGADSRTELTFSDGTLLRLAPNSLFRFDGKRTVDLGGGALLLHVPRNSGTTVIETDLINVSTTGATVVVERLDLRESAPAGTSVSGGAAARYRVSVLEGQAQLCCVERPDECVTVEAKRAVIGAADKCLGTQVKFDTGEWLRSNQLITGFSPLPAHVVALIGAAPAGTTLAALFRQAGFAGNTIGAPGIGTINPSNLSGGGGSEVSPNEERSTICHNGQTLTLPRQAAERHLRNHPQDSAGACQ